MHYPNTNKIPFGHNCTYGAVYSKNTLKKMGLLSETQEVLLRFIKTPNIHVSRWRHPPKTVSPRPYCRSRIDRNGLDSETTTSILAAITKIIKNTSIRHLTIIQHTCEHSGLR